LEVFAIKSKKSTQKAKKICLAILETFGREFCQKIVLPTLAGIEMLMHKNWFRRFVTRV